MAEALKEEVDTVVWDEQQDVSICVIKIIFRELRLCIHYPLRRWGS
jgi:hypothetical protein